MSPKHRNILRAAETGYQMSRLCGGGDSPDLTLLHNEFPITGNYTGNKALSGLRLLAPFAQGPIRPGLKPTPRILHIPENRELTSNIVNNSMAAPSDASVDSISLKSPVQELGIIPDILTNRRVRNFLRKTGMPLLVPTANNLSGV